MQRSLLSFLLIATASMLLSCGGDGEPTPSPQKNAQQQAVEQLAGGSTITWTVANGGAVTKDGQSLTGDFSGFELKLIDSGNGRTYATTANPLFDQNGNWNFVGESLDKILLTGKQPAAGKEISFSRNGDKLTLTFNVPVPNARVEALAGSYVFELMKK